MRAAPPAMTPVPGAAGFSSTRPAPVMPEHGMGDGGAGERHGEQVLFASSVPFWMANGTSFALP